MMRGWSDQQRPYDEVRQLFNDIFHNENPISKSTVERMSFEEIGSVKSRTISERSTVGDY